MGPAEKPSTDIGWTTALLPAVAGWAWARVCVALGFLLSNQMVDVLDNPGGQSMIDRGLFVWDGAYYRVLARAWYDGANPDAARFFPLYPKLASILAPVLGGNTDTALLVISNVGSFIGAVVLWRLALETLGNGSLTTSSEPQGPGEERVDHLGGWRNLRDITGSHWHRTAPATQAVIIANRSAWMVALFPAGFVFAFAYSEGLALALTAGALLALRRSQFLVAALLALLASVVRPVGVLLIIPIAVELWQARPRVPFWKAGTALAAPVAGLLTAFIWIELSTHDLMRPLRLQQEIRGGFQDPFTRVLEPIGEILKGNFRDAYNFGFMVVFIFLGYQAVRFRQPLSWLAFSLVSSVILLSSQVTDSLGRYGLLVVPFIVAGAQWADKRWKQGLYAAGASIAMVWLVSETMIGRLVP